MTAPTQRIEVDTRGERRRRWSIEEKREIVAESLGAGIRPSEIIHKYGITSGQLVAGSKTVAHPPAVATIAGPDRSADRAWMASLETAYPCA